MTKGFRTFKNIRVSCRLAGEDKFYAEGHWWCIFLTVVAMLMARFIFMDFGKRD
ncbi:hypothetical protein [Ulvibacterium sp.]|uniref:hypothetical protein n=1 Tax=Ulvibacterium sp. TaxID=2665914 RepID=UPI003BA8B329